MREPSALDYLFVQISKPDNVPAVLLLALTAFYGWLTWRKARINDRRDAPVEAAMADKVQVWPYLVRVEFLTSIAVMIILTVWSIGIDAPLEEPANPALTPNPSKAPWYFLGLQELLTMFHPMVAGVLLPGMVLMVLILAPYVDKNPSNKPEDRKFAISMMTIHLMMWATLVMIGSFFRGPGQNFVFPWEAGLFFEL